MPAAAAANGFVIRVGHAATGIADGGSVHTIQLPEFAFSTPKTPKAENSLLQIFGERRLDRIAVDEM